MQLGWLRFAPSRPLAEPAGRRFPPTAERVLPFSTWFARSARNADVLLLLGELIIMNVPHLALLMFQCACVPVAGTPHAALQVREKGMLSVTACLRSRPLQPWCYVEVLVIKPCILGVLVNYLFKPC